MDIDIQITLTDLRWIKGSNRIGKRYKTVVIPVSKETRLLDIFSWDDCKTKENQIMTKKWHVVT